MRSPAVRRSARASTRGRWADLPVYGLGLLLALGLEVWARTHYEAGSHLLGQRQGEYHGNAALALLLLALAARPLARVWPWPLRHRRALGVLAFAFSAAHTGHAYKHVLGGSLETLAFLTPARQAALWLGIGALGLLLPLWLTSNAWATRRLGRRWTLLHRLAVPALLLAVAHTAWMGVHYGLEPVTLSSAALFAVTAVLMLARLRKAKR